MCYTTIYLVIVMLYSYFFPVCTAICKASVRWLQPLPSLQCLKKFLIQGIKPTLKIYIYKRNEELGMNIQEKNWELIFKICLKTVQDNDIIWLQYRVLHRIRGTQYILQKIGKAESSLCLQCNDFPETLLHLFYHYNKSQIIFNEFKTWIQNAINFTLNIQPRDLMLGYFNKDRYFLPINTIIMLTKKFLFKNSRKSISFKFKNLQEDVKNVYVDQKLVAKYNFKEEVFHDNWKHFVKLFD